MVKQFVIINGHKELLFHIERDGKVIMINILPEMRESKDIFDNQVKLPFVGIEANKTIKKKLNILKSLSISVHRTYEMSANILTSLSQLVTGQKKLKRTWWSTKNCTIFWKINKYGSYNDPLLHCYNIN